MNEFKEEITLESCCVICTNNFVGCFKSDPPVRIDTCGHLSHLPCLENWFSVSRINRCPTCNVPCTTSSPVSEITNLGKKLTKEIEDILNVTAGEHKHLTTIDANGNAVALILHPTDWDIFAYCCQEHPGNPQISEEDFYEMKNPALLELMKKISDGTVSEVVGDKRKRENNDSDEELREMINCIITGSKRIERCYKKQFLEFIGPFIDFFLIYQKNGRVVPFRRSNFSGLLHELTAPNPFHFPRSQSDSAIDIINAVRKLAFQISR
jgi:hypothetical protein